MNCQLILKSTLLLHGISHLGTCLRTKWTNHQILLHFLQSIQPTACTDAVPACLLPFLHPYYGCSLFRCFVCSNLLNFKILIEFYLFNMTLSFCHFSTIFYTSNTSYYIMQVCSKLMSLLEKNNMLFRTFFPIHDSFTIAACAKFLENVVNTGSMFHVTTSNSFEKLSREFNYIHWWLSFQFKIFVSKTLKVGAQIQQN